MRNTFRTLQPVFLLMFIVLPGALWAADIDRFVGSYMGNAEFEVDGQVQRRDVSTTIAPTKDGFSVSWTSISYKDDGRSKSKSYTIEFTPTQRDHIYGSAMKTNVFGKPVPLDPLKGEPFVWARFEGDTFSLFSLLINEQGEYDMQEYHRTLVEGGLDLVFRSVQNAAATKEIRTFLAKVD